MFRCLHWFGVCQWNFGDGLGVWSRDLIIRTVRRWCGLTLFSQDRESGTNLGLASLLNEDLGENPLIKSLHCHGGFISLYLSNLIADFHLVADALEPAHYGAFGHGIRELGHFDMRCHWSIRARCCGWGRPRSIMDPGSFSRPTGAFCHQRKLVFGALSRQ